MQDQRQQKPASDARLAFRLPRAVAEDWRRRAEAAGLSLSDFVRSAVDARQTTGIAPPGKRRRRRNYTPADPELVRQVARIGNNLNQIARWVNIHKSGIEAVELLAHLSALGRAFSSLLPHKERSDENEVLDAHQVS